MSNYWFISNSMNTWGAHFFSHPRLMAKVGGHRERQAEVREAGEEAPAPQLALAEMFQSERQSKRILIGVMSLATAATLMVMALP